MKAELILSRRVDADWCPRGHRLCFRARCWLSDRNDFDHGKPERMRRGRSGKEEKDADT